MRVLYMHTLRDERTGRALQPPRGTSGLLRDAAQDARDRGTSGRRARRSTEDISVHRGRCLCSRLASGRRPVARLLDDQTPPGGGVSVSAPSSCDSTAWTARGAARGRRRVVASSGRGGARLPTLHPPSPCCACGEGCVRALLRGAAPRRGMQSFFFRPGASERLNAASVSAVRRAGEPDG